MRETKNVVLNLRYTPNSNVDVNTFTLCWLRQKIRHLDNCHLVSKYQKQKAVTLTKRHLATALDLQQSGTQFGINFCSALTSFLISQFGAFLKM